MANERQNRILGQGQGHALGISAGHLPPVIMAELPGKRGHPSLACCYLVAFKPRPSDGVGKLAICLLVLKILFSPTGPGHHSQLTLELWSHQGADCVRSGREDLTTSWEVISPSSGWVLELLTSA